VGEGENYTVKWECNKRAERNMQMKVTGLGEGQMWKTCENKREGNKLRN